MPRLRPRKSKNDVQPTKVESDSVADEQPSGFVIDRTSSKCAEERDCFVIDRTCTSSEVTPDTNEANINESTTVTKFSRFVIPLQDGEINSERNNQSDDIQQDGQEESTQSSPQKNKHDKKKRKKFALSCSLQDGMKESLYISGQQSKKSLPQVNKKSIDELMKSSVLSSDIEKQHNLPPYQVSLNQTRKQRQKERSQSKGKAWFDMKAPEMTEEKKNDLTVLQMRRVLDPKHFYKNPDIRALPKFFQMGKIVEDATDFYSARIPKKDRKRTLVDELLEDTEFRRYNKKKYTEITQKYQASHSRKGAAKHMKRLKKSKK